MWKEGNSATATFDATAETHKTTIDEKQIRIQTRDTRVDDTQASDSDSDEIEPSDWLDFCRLLYGDNLIQSQPKSDWIDQWEATRQKRC